MEASKPEETNAVPGSGAVTAPEPVRESSGQGDFSLKPAGRKKGNNKLVILIVVGALVLAILLVGLMAFFILRHPDGETPVDESTVKASPLLQGASSTDNSMSERMGSLAVAAEYAQKQKAAAQAAPPAKEAPMQDNVAPVASAGPSTPGSDYAQSGNAQPVQQHEETMFTPIGRFDSSGMSSGSGGGAGSPSSSPGGDDQEAKLKAFINGDPAEMARNLVNASGGAAAGGGGLTGSGGGGSLLDNLGGTHYAATQAGLAPPGKFRLKKYTSFQCVLINGIKTDYPGFTKCSLTMPLYSADGSVILARAGAELRGEQKVELKGGQSSVFTTWTELETSVAGSSQSVLTQLNGLGTDAMGRSGTDAEIDNHWGMKIGGALMLSTFQDALGNFSKRLSGGNNGSNNYSNTENTTEDMASKVLDANINIAPTGYVKPGTVINVVVAQDIDFSRVFMTRG